LENGGSENDEVPGGMWKAVEDSTGKVGMGEAKERREKGRSWKKEGRKEKEEDKEKGKDDGSKESSRGMGDIGQGGRSSKVRGRG